MWLILAVVVLIACTVVDQVMRYRVRRAQRRVGFRDQRTAPDPLTEAEDNWAELKQRAADEKGG